MTFKDLANKRFACRKYTDEPVSKEDIEYIKECVQLAPSAHNFQPWKFLIVTSEEGKAKVRQCYNRPWFANIPMFGIAVEHLCLAAADRGLGTCWVCNYDVEAVKRLFSVEGYEAVAIVPVGHIAPDCPHPEKRRKDLSEIFEEI